MFSMETIGRLLLIGSALIAAVGLLLLLAGRLGLGRLPGDIIIQRESISFYFPLATMLIISLILTVVINLLRR